MAHIRSRRCCHWSVACVENASMSPHCTRCSSPPLSGDLVQALGRYSLARLACMASFRASPSTFELLPGRLRVCSRPSTHLRRLRHRPRRIPSKLGRSYANTSPDARQPSETCHDALWRKSSHKYVCVSPLRAPD